MAQTKRSLYDFYESLGAFLHRKMIKSLPSKERKMMTEKKLFQDILDSSPDLIHSLDFLIASEELYWKEEGRHAIFPENKIVLDNLLRAKYQMESSEGFDLPFPSFIVAIPYGYEFDGVKVPSFMVTHIEYRKSQDITIHPFCEYLETPFPNSVGYQDTEDGAKSITITFKDPSSHGYLRMMQIENKLPAILASESLQDFRIAVGDYRNKVGAIQSSEHDLRTQFVIMKLIAALGVYNLATEGARLQNGFPGSIAPRLMGKHDQANVAFTTLSGSVNTDNIKASPQAHYRAWHFRQLRDERYYKGKHQSMTPGSRYSFVSDTLVGQKISPHTQKQ